ncbi:MAG: SpoIID/LytB domain-containing protein [Clostridia bacterium]|nr:SpoIID/LytB domain-containing protein [Clostridia bacterium]
MALLQRTAALIIALLMIFMLLPVQANDALAESDGMVRVKLTRLGTPKTISFTAGCDYYVNGDINVKIAAGSTVKLDATGGGIMLSCNGYTLDMGDDFAIMRKNAGKTGVKFNSPALANVFTGDLRFMLSSGGITTILHIYVEDYLCGVIAYEMSNSYPIEALKAQAVAARNYVLRAKLSRASLAYDVTDTTSDQVFRGYNSSYTNVSRAVEATEGVVLGYDGKLAACYYGASNGGQTESTKNIWGTDLAYSVVKDDMYDLASASKCNTATIKKDQTGTGMNASLKAALLNGMVASLEKYDCSTDPEVVRIEEIIAIEPHSPKYPEPSRLYTKLRFTVRVSSVTSLGDRIAGNVQVDVNTYGAFEEWYKLSLNSGANETITVEETETAFKISFRRWGHGVGLSQHGARVMARDHAMGYKEILEFYYPGTKIYTLSLADTTGSGLKDGGSGAVPVEPTVTAEPTNVPEATKAPESSIAPVMQARVQLSSASSKLNVRSSPNTSSEVLAKLRHGDIVDVYALEGDWVAIGAKGVLGHVMKKYLVKIDAEPEATVAPTAAPTAEPTTAPEEEGEYLYAQVKLKGSTSRLNLRQKPSTSAKILAKLKNGDVVKVTAVDGDWAKSETGTGIVGYAHKSYLVRVQDDTPAATAAPVVTPQPTQTPVPEITEKPGESVTAEATEYTFIYSAADDGARPVAGMNVGDRVTVTAVENGWAKVQFGRYQGYVPVDCLKLVK